MFTSFRCGVWSAGALAIWFAFSLETLPVRAVEEPVSPPAGETNAPATSDTSGVPPIPATTNELSDRDVLVRILEELRAAREREPERPTLEEQFRQFDALAVRVGDTLAGRLDSIERGLSQQHQRDLETLESSNRTVLLIAGVFAGFGFLGVMVAVVVLVRAINRLSEVAMTFPMHGLGTSAPGTAIGVAELTGGGAAHFEQASTRFIGAIERLEKRILELEQSTHSAALEISHAAHDVRLAPASGAGTATVRADAPQAAASGGQPSNGDRERAEAAGTTRESEVGVLMGKGQALLNLGQSEEALRCFDQVAVLEPRNADVFVKRGMALERLQKMEEAIESYDRAIEANNSMTLAYLYKGAICNRLQRFREALECYEKALKSEQKPAG